MAKRNATSELTRDNWDDDEEREDPGEFAVASTDQICQRRIRVAKRRLGPGEEVKKAPSSSIFGSFAGFSSKTSSNAVFSAATSSASIPAPKCGIIFPSLPPSDRNRLPSPTNSKLPELVTRPYQTTVSGGSSSAATNKSSEFREAVKSLNLCMITWLQENVQENPYVNFAPVCEDYKKHFAELEEKHKPKVTTGKEGTAASAVAGGSKRSRNGINSNGSAETTSLSTTGAIDINIIAPSNTVKPVAPTITNSGGAVSLLSSTPASATVMKSSSSPASAVSTKAFTFGLPTTTASIAGGTTPKFGFGKTTGSATTVPSNGSNAPKFSFGNTTSSAASLSSGAGAKSAFGNFGSATSTAAFGSTAPKFAFGNSVVSSTTSQSSASGTAPKFAFGNTGGSPFTFSAKPKENATDDDQKDGNPGDDEAEYEPPKPERVEQVEEDAFYNVRCKLFYKKAGKFVEKGVGTLFLKPLEGGPKVQLLVRADNTLGNVLLNLALNDSIPCSRSGKNNVTLVCVPNPPLDPKSDSTEPAMLLVRVKTSEEADKLLEELNKAKSST